MGGGSRRPVGPGAGDSDSDGDENPRQPANGEAHPRRRPPRRLPKQFNSDWNTVVEEKEGEANLFFNIFSAPS